MSLSLKDLPCRNPDNFTRLHTTGAIRRIAIRPTYTAELDSDAKEIINDPIPMIIHRLSRLPKDESLKRSIVEDESQVPSFTMDQTKRTKPTTILQQSNFIIDCHEEIS